MTIRKKKSFFLFIMDSCFLSYLNFNLVSYLKFVSYLNFNFCFNLFFCRVFNFFFFENVFKFSFAFSLLFSCPVN